MTWTVERIDDCADLPLADDSVDLCVTSPPYGDARLYGDLRFRKAGNEWVNWAVTRFVECLRVCRGPVCWVVNGQTKSGVYSCGPEYLMCYLHDMGYGVKKQLVYYRIGSMNGGGASRMPRDVWEPIIVATRRKKAPPWADLHDAGTDAVITRPGGRVSQRKRDGSRVTDGKRVQPDRAIMKNVVDCGAVGGGHMGHDAAGKSEAPFALSLVEPIVKAWCPPGGTVLDPMCGSGTTLHAAILHGRNAIGFDARRSQVRATTDRLKDVEKGLS